MKDLIKVIGVGIISFYGLYLFCSICHCMYMLDWSYKTILAGVGIGFAIAMMIKEVKEEYDEYEEN